MTRSLKIQVFIGVISNELVSVKCTYRNYWAGLSLSLCLHFLFVNANFLRPYKLRERSGLTSEELQHTIWSDQSAAFREMWWPDINFLLFNYHTKRRGSVVNTPASYSGVPGFKSRCRHRISWLYFSWLSSVPLVKFWDSALNYDSFQIISNSSFIYLFILRYIVWSTEKKSR
jgi:hypothetical protein